LFRGCGENLEIRQSRILRRDDHELRGFISTT
jgi:hypothetical protein